jgi:hypothetical protein
MPDLVKFTTGKISCRILPGVKIWHFSTGTSYHGVIISMLHKGPGSITEMLLQEHPTQLLLSVPASQAYSLIQKDVLKESFEISFITSSQRCFIFVSKC